MNEVERVPARQLFVREAVDTLRCRRVVDQTAVLVEDGYDIGRVLQKGLEPVLLMAKGIDGDLVGAVSTGAGPNDQLSLSRFSPARMTAPRSSPSHDTHPLGAG